VKTPLVASLIVLGAVSPPASLARPAPGNAPPVATVSGTVFDSASGKPLSNVRLVAHARAVRFVGAFATLDSAVTRSDASGRFAFPPLHPGPYVAWARPELGWCGRRIDFVAPDSGTVVLRVGLHAVVLEGDYTRC
jgi:hypothetical protein